MVKQKMQPVQLESTYINATNCFTEVVERLVEPDLGCRSIVSSPEWCIVLVCSKRIQTVCSQK